MRKLKDTLSVCESCYRHVPSVKFEREGQIWLKKTCKVHGESEHLIEPDAEFYLNYEYIRDKPKSYMLDITNRCNLTCPNCHQEPDNTSKDLPIDYYINLIASWPDNAWPIALCGAEPTVRKDLPKFVSTINAMPYQPRPIIILTNAVKLADLEYCKQFQQFNNVMWTIGLNHPDYQGPVVRKKQIQGIENLKSLNYTIKNISYTLETLDQMEYCLNEIQEFGLKYCAAFRIRTGVDIGRYPGGPYVYMSDLVNEAKRTCKKNNWPFIKDHSQGNRAHYATIINNIPIKIIQWPNAKTLDLSEVQTESTGNFVPGKPPSPLIHQIILRDALINKKMMLFDTIPKEWVDNYGG